MDFLFICSDKGNYEDEKIHRIVFMLPSNLVTGRFVVYSSHGGFLGIEKFSSEDSSFHEAQLKRLRIHVFSG